MKARVRFDCRRVNIPVELRQLKYARVTVLPGILRLSQAGSRFSYASFITSSLKEICRANQVILRHAAASGRAALVIKGRP